MGYHILFLPLLSLVVAQTAKTFINANKLSLSLKNLFAYSGMPSGHSALVVSLSTIIGLETSFHSAEFAISLVLAVVVIRDALGLRRYLGEHGRVLNILVDDLQNDAVLESTYPHLLEKIGHTPLQVFVGSLIGFLVSTLGFFLLN